MARPNGAPELAFVDDLYNVWGDVIMCGNEKTSTARPFGAQVLKTELELGIVVNNDQILNGKHTYKPRRLQRLQRAQAHNSIPNSRQRSFM